MSIRSRLIGRRVLAAVVSVGLTSGVVAAAPTVLVPQALAAPSSTPAPGQLSVASPSVAAGAAITVTGTGFAPRTQGQSLAVDLLQKDGNKKVRFTLPSTTEGSSFDSMEKREGEDIYFGIISNVDQLPTAANNGDFTFTVKIPETTAPGNYVLVVKGGKYGTNAPAVLKMVPITVTAAGEHKAPAVKAFFGRTDAPNIEDTTRGTTVTGTFTGLPQGTKVTAVGVLDGETIPNSWLPAGDFVAGDNGEVVVPGIAIPADAPLGDALSATFTTPDGTTLVATARRNGVTPNVGQSNPELIKVLAEHATPGGLYQSAYDPATKDLFVTFTSFYTGDSGILKANPATLDYSTLVTIPPTEDKKASGDAVFGIAYDAAHQRLWTTNTTGSGVTVYGVDGSKVAHLPLTNMVDGKNKAHPRDVVIDEAGHKAYVGDAAGPGGKIYVFDTNTITDGAAPEATIEIPEFGDRGPLELKLDAATKTIWTVGFNGKYLAKVELGNGNKVTAYSLDNADVHGNRGAGLAIDTKRGMVYAASQEPSHVKVFDIKQEKVVDTIVTGASPLDALYDPIKDVVYVANRLAGTVNVIDPETRKIVATRDVAPYPNQLSTDGSGTVFLTTKAYLGRYPAGSKYKTDTIYALTFDKKEGDDPGTKPGSSNPGAGSSGNNNGKQGNNGKQSNNGKQGNNGSDVQQKPDNSQGSSELTGSMKDAGPLVAIGAVLTLVLGALGFAVTSGMVPLPPGFPALPGFPVPPAK